MKESEMTEVKRRTSSCRFPRKQENALGDYSACRSVGDSTATSDAVEIRSAKKKKNRLKS